MPSPRHWSGAALAVLALSLSAVLASPALQLSSQQSGSAGASTGPRETSLPPPVASYTLRARLDPDTHTVHGDGTINWVNTSLASTDELYFHLYLNAFASAETVFNRSPFTRARSGRRSKQWGHISLQRLRARELGDLDLLLSLEAHSPDDPEDATDRRVKLPRALLPGESLTLDISWESVLPEILERTGFSRDFYFVGQWFPKLARLERDGSWAHFTFHPHAEFYSDFGSYTVTLDVPEAMVVGATGHRSSEVVAHGRRVVEQRADGVHDFAWTAWSGFREQHERMGDIDVHLLYPTGHARNAERTLETLRFALPHFEGRYGKYPYPDLTVVHPPAHAAAAGGMEYPTLITTGGPWHASLWSRAVELVTLHELGHQWFYGLIASNEHAWPFLDEGLNSYAESVAAEALFGSGSASKLPGLQLSVEPLRRAGMLLAPHDGPIAQPASGFVDFNELGSLVYSRTALLFRTIANVYGAAELETALRRYAERYRFGHPGPEELLRVLTETLGPAPVANIRGALFEGQSVNYSVRDLRSVASSTGAARYESRVAVYRQGELRFPVEVVLLTASGERISKHWDGEGRVELVTHEGPEPVVTALVDPSNAIWLDEDLLDNATSRDPRSPSNTSERSLFGFQWLLGLLEP